MLKMSLVRTIAEGFVLRHAAAADRYYGAALKAINIALRIYYFKIAVYLYRTVTVYCEFCCCHVAKIG